MPQCGAEALPMSLRLRLNLLVASLVAAFLLATAALIVDDARRSIREEIASGTRITVQLLSAVVYAGTFYPTVGTQREFVLSFLRSLGRVRAHDIVLTDPLGNVVYRSPPSVYKAGRDSPAWFARLVLPRTEPVALALPGGTLTITPDPSRAVVDAWDDVKKLAGIAALLLAVAVPLVIALVARSLRPLDRLSGALADLERGRLDTRLPRIGSPEFAAIGERFNRMAAALEQRTAENRRLALVAQQSSDAMLIEGPDGRIDWCNPAAQRMFADAGAAVPGQRLEDLAGGRAIAAALARMGGETVEHVECSCTGRDGRAIEVAVSAAPLVDAQRGERLGRILSVRDVTEHRRALEAERALDESRRLTQLIQKHVEDERRSLARELHDELGQSVTAIKSIGTSIAHRTRDTAPEIHASSRMIVDVAARLYDAMHDIVRQLRPSALDHLGLRDALEGAIQAAQAQHPGVSLTLTTEGALDGLGEAVNIGAYRIVQECLTNALRHSRATCIAVSLRRIEGADGPRLELEVRDNGRGLGAVNEDAAPRFGVLGVQERVQALGGTFAISAAPAGSGVRAAACIPLAGVATTSEARA
jgi:PAS domain S-box-containing protein